MSTIAQREANAWQRFCEQETSPAAAEATREFLSAVNHKLSQPLTAFRCCIELAMLKQEDGEKAREHLGLALEQSDRVHALIHAFQELLDSALEHRERNRFDLSALVNKTVQDMSSMADTRQILLVRAPLPALPAMADYQRFSRAMSVLMDHTLACVPTGESLAISAVDRSHGTVIQLHNPAYRGQDHLFDPFASSRGYHSPISNLSAVIAQNTFRSAGGALTIEPSLPGRAIELSLPVLPPVSH